MTPAARLRAAARRVRVLAARVDLGVFLELVLTDEATGEPIRLAAHHREWVGLLRDHSRLALLAHVEAGKSQIVSIGLTLWTLGRDPTVRAAIISSACTQAEAAGHAIRKYVESPPSSPLHQVFPALRPSPEGLWNATRMTVARATSARHASINLFGTDGPISGLRCDLLILDDCVDDKNSASPAQREKLSHTFYSEFFGRMTARARFVAINTVYHRDDLLHVLARNGVPTFRYPVVDEATGAPRWPERWPMSRILEARKGMPVAQFARQLLCRLVSDESSVFRPEWIDAALARGVRHLSLGRTADGRPGLTSLRDVRGGERIVIGVDPSAGAHDLTAICVLLARPGRSEVLSVESGKWDFPTAVDRILDANARFGGADALVIEAVGGFASFPQQLRRFDGLGSVIPYKTARGEMSLQARLAELEMEFRDGRVAFPSEGGRLVDREVAALVQELRDLSRGDDRIEDRTVSLLLAIWGVNEATRRRAEVFTLDTISR